MQLSWCHSRLLAINGGFATLLTHLISLYLLLHVFDRHQNMKFSISNNVFTVRKIEGRESYNGQEAKSKAGRGILPTWPRLLTVFSNLAHFVSYSEHFLCPWEIILSFGKTVKCLLIITSNYSSYFCIAQHSLVSSNNAINKWRVPLKSSAALNTT